MVEVEKGYFRGHYSVSGHCGTTQYETEANNSKQITKDNKNEIW
jgi:hypothetical protein